MSTGCQTWRRCSISTKGGITTVTEQLMDGSEVYRVTLTSQPHDVGKSAYEAKRRLAEALIKAGQELMT